MGGRLEAITSRVYNWLGIPVNKLLEPDNQQ
jgi:hypothetical protein